MYLDSNLVHVNRDSTWQPSTRRECCKECKSTVAVKIDIMGLAMSQWVDLASQKSNQPSTTTIEPYLIVTVNRLIANHMVLPPQPSSL
jgi:hypothetical protein